MQIKKLFDEKIDERISYHESPVYTIARTLKDKGYEIASSTGVKLPEPYHNVIGILKPRGTQKRFLELWKKESESLHLGTLWLDDKLRGAKYDENWVLEVYGRENVTELTELVKELSEPWGVHVQIRLESEKPKFESYYLRI